MRKTWLLWFLAALIIFACSPTRQIQESVALALTQTQAARPTLFPTFTPRPTITRFPTRTPLAGDTPLLTGTPSPPGTESLPAGETATASGPYPPPGVTPTPSPLFSTPTPTPTTVSGGYPPPPTASGGYPAPPTSISPASSTPTQTPTVTVDPLSATTPTPTAMIDPLYTPSITPTPSITLSPTVTRTPNPNFSPTASLTPTRTPSPTRTPTPTRTVGPSPTPSLTLTPTPALPDLTTLIIDTGDLNALANLWNDPPDDITDDLIDLGGEVCDVTCIGLEWTSLDSQETLVLTAYRTIAFEEASQAAFSAQFVYFAQGFELESLPPGVNLPTQTWVASKWGQDFVIFTSQGPAVLSFFWHADIPLDVEATVGLIAEYMDVQAEILRLNGYITVNPNATPLP